MLLAIEVPAVARGAVSFECPREVYVKLNWNENPAALPGDWTIFLPLNARYIPLHDRIFDDDDDDANNDEANEDESGDIDYQVSASDPEEIV